MFNKDIDVHDASMYLRRTYVNYRGRLCYVQDVYSDEEIVLSLREVRSEKQMNVPLSSPCLDFKPLPLGYINTELGAQYFRRYPERTCKQGITDLPMMQGKEICRAARGVYPSFKEARSKAKETCRKVAFSKVFAISPKDILYYKGHKIGMYTDKGIVVEKGLEFLRNKMQGVINANGS